MKLFGLQSPWYLKFPAFRSFHTGYNFSREKLLVKTGIVFHVRVSSLYTLHPCLYGPFRLYCARKFLFTCVECAWFKGHMGAPPPPPGRIDFRVANSAWLFLLIEPERQSLQLLTCSSWFWDNSWIPPSLGFFPLVVRKAMHQL